MIIAWTRYVQKGGQYQAFGAVLLANGSVKGKALLRSASEVLRAVKRIRHF
jgi:hypothetical protein